MVGSARAMVYRFGSFTLDLGRGALVAAGDREVALRPKSFAVLRFLVENAGQLLSRDAIMEAVWSNIYVTDDNITQCIHDIRRGLNGECDELLRTVPRRGYIFVASVVVERPASHWHPPGPSHDLDAPGRSVALPPGGIKFHGAEKRSIGNGLERQLSSLKRPRDENLTRMSVLVTLLRDVGVPDKCKYLVEAISEDIATDLSHLPGTFVVGHTESLRHDDETSSARDTARRYGVNYIIQGSIRGSTDQIGVNAQLIDSETGVHLWAERFDIECVSAPDASNEMTGRLVRALSVQLIEHANRRIEALPPEAWSGYDLVVHGRALMAQPYSSANRQMAVGFFQQALVGGPGLIDAKVGIATVLVANILDGWSTSVEDDRARAEQLLQDILRVNADLPLGHVLMGMLRRWEGQLEDSQIELEIAIKLFPNDARAIGQLGQTLAFSGNPEAAIPHFERSLRLAPHDAGTPVNHSTLGLCHLLLGHAEEAIICLKKARAGNPGLYYIHLHLAAALGLRGELEEASAALRRAAEIKPELLRRSSMIGLLKNPPSRYSALWLKTCDVGLRRAGMRGD